MSTIDRAKPATAALPPLEAGQRLDRATFHERYEAMPPETRAELIGGVVYMPSPLSPDHGDENYFVTLWLGQYTDSTPVVQGTLNTSTLLDDQSETQPDISLRLPPGQGGQTRIEGGYLAGAPESVVEIARSSSRIDLGPKKDDYERAGVLEYLVFEITPNRVHWFVRRGDRFEPLTAGDDGVYRSEVFPGLWLEPAAFFEGDRPRVRAVVDQGLATPEHAAFVDRLARAGGQGGGG